MAIVRGAQGKVAHELEIANREGAHLQVADGEAVCCDAAEGLVVDGLEGEGEARARLLRCRISRWMLFGLR